MERLSSEVRARLLFYATGLKRLPPGGFGGLTPPFTLQLLGSSHAGFAPVAHTCFNVLQLGTYDDDAHLERMLSLALELGGESFSEE